MSFQGPFFSGGINECNVNHTADMTLDHKLDQAMTRDINLALGQQKVKVSSYLTWKATRADQDVYI